MALPHKDPVPEVGKLSDIGLIGRPTFLQRRFHTDSYSRSSLSILSRHA
jgi:hypothetical protein